MCLLLTLRTWALHTIPHTRRPHVASHTDRKEDMAVGATLRTVVLIYRLLCCGIGTSSCPRTYLFSASKGGEQLERMRIMLSNICDVKFKLFIICITDCYEMKSADGMSAAGIECCAGL